MGIRDRDISQSKDLIKYRENRSSILEFFEPTNQHKDLLLTFEFKILATNFGPSVYKNIQTRKRPKTSRKDYEKDGATSKKYRKRSQNRKSKSITCGMVLPN